MSSQAKFNNRLKYVKDLFPKVSKVVDSKQTIRIEVKNNDCKSAQSNVPDDCALAKAMRRQLKADGVIVGMSAIYSIRGDTAVRFKTPPSVQREITSFDRHHDFAPGTYSVSRISPTARLGGRKDRRVGSGQNKDRHTSRHSHTERTREIYEKKLKRKRK